MDSGIASSLSELTHSIHRCAQRVESSRWIFLVCGRRIDKVHSLLARMQQILGRV